MKRIKIKFALMAVAAAGMLSISSCEKGEKLQGTFIHYPEPYENHCVKDQYEIKGIFSYVNPENDASDFVIITGHIPSEFKQGDTAMVSVEIKCVYDASESIGITHSCNSDLYKFKSVERI